MTCKRALAANARDNIMAIRRQDIFVVLLHYLGFSRVRNLLSRIRGTALTKFVVFHDLPPSLIDDFRAKLTYLKENTNVISMDDYVAGHVSAGKVNVIITFDDGYKSWVTTAMPMLRELELTATFFISSGFVGLTQDAEAEFVQSKLKTAQKATGCLTEHDIRTLAEEGFTIGGHTCNHVDLSITESEAGAMQEILEDKRQLESILGQDIHYFAYPFGSDSNAAVDLIGLLKGAGYRGAVTTRPGFNNDASDPYLLRRDLTGSRMSISAFGARVTGNYDAVMFVKKRLGKMLHPVRGRT